MANDPSPIDPTQLSDIAARSEAVRHGIDRLRRGDMVAIGPAADRVVVAAVETLTEAALAGLRAQAPGSALSLAMTPPRAGALGLGDERAPFLAGLRPSVTCAELLALAKPIATEPQAVLATGAAEAASPAIAAALDLAKLAGLMPMLLVARGDATGLDHAPLPLAAVAGFAVDSARWVTQVAATRLPLADAEDTHLVAFRPWGGGPEHLAIVIGQPDVTQPVLTRIHSSCFTGDLIGSLRCDCGDQLRGAIRAIAAQGAGVVVYLPQEGRGIGLVNKLRAYALQDAGFDTIDANTHLGFEPDERSYVVAGEILRRLGITRIRLLTNNPGKRAALDQLGVEVVDRVPLVIASNPHNEAYLRTKALRDGHSF
jgi:GTP cyclohydrolase II